MNGSGRDRGAAGTGRPDAVAPGKSAGPNAAVRCRRILTQLTGGKAYRLFMNGAASPEPDEVEPGIAALIA